MEGQNKNFLQEKDSSGEPSDQRRFDAKANSRQCQAGGVREIGEFFFGEDLYKFDKKFQAQKDNKTIKWNGKNLFVNGKEVRAQDIPNSVLES